MATQYKKASDIATKNNIDLNNDYLMGVNGTSNYNFQMQRIKDMATDAAKEWDTSNIFIFYYENSRNFAKLAELHQWPGLQNAGQIAAGVLVYAGEKHIIVAANEELLPWSSATGFCGGYTTIDRGNAFHDWAGKANSDAQIVHTECQGSNYAIGFCKAYSRPNSGGYGLTAGKWWAPSVAEMVLVKAFRKKINYALSLINGATQLSSDYYFTSTEANANSAWTVNLLDGDLGYIGKTYARRIRPVCQYIS